MFLRQVKHYEEKFNNMLGSLSFESNFLPFMKGTTKWTESDLKTEFLNNSNDFRVLAYNFAKTLVPGKISCTVYAVVIALVAKHFNVPYKVLSGFCLPKSYVKFDEEIAAFNARKAEGVEHPVMATHVFVTCNDICYEFYNGDTSNIEHIDCVELNTK